MRNQNKKDMWGIQFYVGYDQYSKSQVYYSSQRNRGSKSRVMVSRKPRELKEGFQRLFRSPIEAVS